MPAGRLQLLLQKRLEPGAVRHRAADDQVRREDGAPLVAEFVGHAPVPRRRTEAHGDSGARGPGELHPLGQDVADAIVRIASGRVDPRLHRRAETDADAQVAVARLPQAAGFDRPVSCVDQIDPAPGQPEVETARDQARSGDPLPVGERPGEREAPDGRGKRCVRSAGEGEVAQLAGDRDCNSPRAEHPHQPGVQRSRGAVESILRSSVVVVVDAQPGGVGVEKEVPVEPARGSRGSRGGSGRVGEQAEGAFGGSEGDAPHADHTVVGDGGAAVGVDDVVAVGDRCVGPGEPRSREKQAEDPGGSDHGKAMSTCRQLRPPALSAFSSGAIRWIRSRFSRRGCR